MEGVLHEKCQGDGVASLQINWQAWEMAGGEEEEVSKVMSVILACS